MNVTNHYALTMETLAELMPEIRSTKANVEQALPDLSKVLKSYSPMPQEALFLGIANDGLPVLLNLKDPIPGPILITSNKSSGKTKLLKMIARSIDECHDPEVIKYAVITNKKEEWDNFDTSLNNEGILPFQHELTRNYLQSLVDWAHSKKQDNKFIILLVDGLESVIEDNEIHQMFRWLLLRGTSHRIWPFVTLNAENIVLVNQWMEFFRTRICGYLTEEKAIQILTDSMDHLFQDLIGGSQFSMRENKQWLPFWLPNLD
jgi:hypothetical protein